jgi:hypothetical protein
MRSVLSAKTSPQHGILSKSKSGEFVFGEVLEKNGARVVRDRSPVILQNPARPAGILSLHGEANFAIGVPMPPLIGTERPEVLIPNASIWFTP